MAKEKVIEIKTGAAVKSVQDLKNNISGLKEQLATLTIGSAKYHDKLKELQENQAALRNAMHGTSASMQQVMDAASAANIAFDDQNRIVKLGSVSYNELVRELAILKQEWRATTDEAARADLAGKINSVNDQLKGMDASVGVFGRNVGNYIGAVDHLTAGLSSMGGGAAAAAGSLKNMTLGLKTMSATPAMAVLGLLANILQKVMEAMKGNEESAEALNQALAPLRVVGDAITKVFQAMGSVLVTVVGWFGKLTTAILGTNKASEERLRLAKEENELNDAQRETLIQNAEAERDIAELRAKASEKDKYTASERMAFLEEAGKKEAEIAAREMQNAKTRYELIRDRNALTKSSEEQLAEEARAYADMVKAQTNYYQSIRTINAGITRARQEEAKAARDAAKAVKDAATAKLNAEKDYISQLLSIVKTGTDGELALQNRLAERERDIAIADAKQKITDRKELTKALVLIEKSYQVQLQKNQQDHDNKVLAEELRSLANRRDALQQGSVEYAAAQEEYAARALDGLRRQMDETGAEFEARRLAALRSLKEAQNATADAIAAETQDALKAQMAGLAEGSIEYLALSLEAARANLDSIYQGIDESIDQYNARRLEAERAVRLAEDALEEGRIDHDRLILENRMNEAEEGSLTFLSRQVELKKYELDTLHQLEGESNEEFRARELAADKEYTQAKRALIQEGIALYQSYSAAVSGLLGSLADMYESDTNASQREVRKAKNLRIAGATIDMLSGVVTAIAQAQQLGPIAGPIMAAINSAAVIAAGTANINKIKAQQVSTGGSSSQTPAVVDAPAVMPAVNEVRNITSDREEERLNAMAGDQRVYILSSDLEADRHSRAVQIAETTF